MASFEKTPPQTTASAVGLLRTLARDEQKKLAHLRATNGAANDIAAAETRVRDLTAKLSAAGLGEFHPIDTNDSREGRARNRRIEIVLVPDDEG